MVFGPLPGNVEDGIKPILKAPAAAAHGTSSGVQAGDISYTSGCEGCVPRTTGTFLVPRSHVSVHVGFPGDPAGACSPGDTALQCAVVTLTAYDSQGQVITSSAPATLTEGAGMGTVLSVQSPTSNIVGFKIAARDLDDHYKVVYIDDLAYDVPATPPPPDFTLTPDTAAPVVLPGQAISDTISIGRLSGSSGDIALALGGTLPPGVHATIAPNPATSTANLSLTADPDAAPTDAPAALTLTGTPSSASAGSAPRTVNLSLTVKRAFDVVLYGPADVDVSACHVRIPFAVARDFAFAGPVALTVTGAPAGMTATMDPAQATFPGGEKAQPVYLDVVAPATGQALPPTTLTVHGVAGARPERTASVSVHGTCPAQYDAQVTSIQITQGTQSRWLPARDGVHEARVPYSDIPNAALLRRDAPTIVRAYADADWGPNPVRYVPMVLAGYYFDRNGSVQTLPGSPLMPNNGPRNLRLGGIDPTIPEMESDDGAYTFTLPPEWTHQTIGISAILQPALPPAAGSPYPVLTPCTTDACKVNDFFALTQIPFHAAPGGRIYPLQMQVGGGALPDPQDVFSWVRRVTPVALDVMPYAGTIDITDIASSSRTGKEKNTAVEDRVDEWACDNDRQAVGVSTGVIYGLTRTGSWCWSLLDTISSASVENARPLTSVAHEWYHLLGRPHASDCDGGGSNGQVAESWPPDQEGYLQSVGINTQLGSGVGGTPYDVVPGSPGLYHKDPNAWYDFMSYCADSTNLAHPLTDALTLDSWISVHNWNAVLSARAYARRVAPRAAARVEGPKVASLVISAAASPADATATILSVTPVQAQAQRASESAYHLIAADASGATLADVPMLEGSDHTDHSTPGLSLHAVVPATAVARVSIVKDGSTLATRERSAHAPTVTAPTVRAGRPNATVTWTATDADADPLVVTVDYSRDGGRTWRQIFAGPNRGKATFPARYLSRAKHARVRVSLRDGFNQTTALSKVFRARGAPPVVHITNPADGLRQPNDATLVLAGQAFDDRGRALTGSHLRWLAGRRLLGTGQQIAVSGLPASTRRIVLVARDSAGRTARDAVTLRLSAARPLFLAASGPKTASRRARRLVLKVASSLPARLVVTGRGVRTQRFAVSRRPRSLHLAVPRGRAPLILTLRLRGPGGAADRRTLRVQRT